MSTSTRNDDDDDNSSSAPAGKCPVDHETRSLWGLLGGDRAQGKPSTTTTTTTNDTNSAAISTPASLEEAARHAQTPLPGQRLPLSTHRVESSIPRGGSSNGDNNNNNNNNSNSTRNIPSHQVHNKNDASNWVYPSEQQVFNAMKRKGWKGIEEESIPSFLQIHNSVNERSWRQVLQWETGDHQSQAQSSVELSRFEGRPKDLTPKAWLLSSLGICDKPFDRHDWYVVNTNNSTNNNNASTTTEERRYVLDFYMHETGGPLPRVEIDVRPALDTPGAVVQRGIRLLREAFPGIAREWDERLEVPASAASSNGDGNAIRVGGSPP
eukprot:jgi/Psemu1/207672/e_gw1.443.39.1